jgi:hypothetical protein
MKGERQVTKIMTSCIIMCVKNCKLFVLFDKNCVIYGIISVSCSNIKFTINITNVTRIHTFYLTTINTHLQLLAQIYHKTQFFLSKPTPLIHLTNNSSIVCIIVMQML